MRVEKLAMSGALLHLSLATEKFNSVARGSVTSSKQRTRREKENYERTESVPDR
jgi:hypothetical protein